MFFITCLCHFFSSLSTCLSWGLPSHSNRSLSQAATYNIYGYGQLTQALLHWQYWLKNHWPKRPFKHWMYPSLDGWQSQLSLSKDQGHPYIHAFKKHGKYFTQSFRYIHINNRDLPQSFQVPGSIDNTTHTRLLRPPMHTRQIIMHTDLISNSAILCNNFVSLLSDL